MFDLITPSDLGLPAKFDKFRKPQREALEWLTEGSCEHKISAACLPTGSGKTLIANALAKTLGVKAVYLVATKALANQVLSDFASSGMADIRGRANYACPNYGDCDTGADAACSISTTVACPYTCAVDKATQSQIPVTNYAYWLHSGGVKNRAFEGTELLVCDEAHNIEKQLSGFAAVKLYAAEMGKEGTQWSRDGAMSEADPENWRGWAKNKADRLLLNVNRYDEEQGLMDRLKRIARMNHPNWVWQFDDRGHVTFEPVRLAQFSRGLFGSVPRVLLMSASLNEFTLKLLIPSDVEYDFKTWGSVFPAANAPVYHIPTVKLNWRSTDEDYKKILDETDCILAARSDRRGIIHAVSYARMRRVLEHSRFLDRFVFNNSAQDSNTVLNAFRLSNPDGVLVSPSFGAGYDFPGSAAEFQIILKFPFPNETQRVIKERCTQIPGYRLWSAAQEIVQMCGRARRYDEDRCETFVLDNSIKQLCGLEGRSYCPPGFRIFTVTQVPPAPPKIGS